MKNKNRKYAIFFVIGMLYFLFPDIGYSKYTIIRNGKPVICIKIENNICIDCFGNEILIRDNEGKWTNEPCPKNIDSEKDQPTSDKEKLLDKENSINIKKK